MAPSTNQQVAIWARGQLGQKVGTGECWELANRALRKANAKSSADLGPMGGDDDYVWGKRIQLKDVVPGDILQFRDFVVTRRTVTEVTFPDGSGETRTEEAEQSRGHHTAVVDAAGSKGVLKILEQNIEPAGKKVQRQTLHTQDSSPAPTKTVKKVKDQTGKLRDAKVVVTVTIEVSGTIWAYRPIRN